MKCGRRITADFGWNYPSRYLVGVIGKCLLALFKFRENLYFKILENRKFVMKNTSKHFEYDGSLGQVGAAGMAVTALFLSITIIPLDFKSITDSPFLVIPFIVSVSSVLNGLYKRSYGVGACGAMLSIIVTGLIDGWWLKSF